MKEDARSISSQRKTRTIRQQFLRVLIGLDLLVISVVTGVLYTQEKQSLIRDIDNTLRAVAVMARELLPPDYHDRIEGPDSVKEQEFEAIIDKYNRLCVAIGLEYIWSLMMIDGRPVFTSSTSPDKVVGNRKHAKFFEVHSNPELYAKTFETMTPTFQTSRDKWGTIRAGLIPGTDRFGRKYLFGASVSLAYVNRQVRVIISQSLMIGLILFMGSVLGTLWISRILMRPIQRLTATIQAISEGQSELEAEENGLREVSILAQHFNRLNRAMHGKISDLEESRVQLIDQQAMVRKQAQDDLSSSEQRYQGLMNFAVDGILIGSNAGIITDANECMCSLFGLERAEIIGKHISQMPFKADDLINNPFRFDLVRAGQTTVRERAIERSDGSMVIVEIHTKMMPDGTLQSIYHDITARKHAEHALSEAYALLADAQRLARLGGWKYDLVTRRSQWTDEVYAILGVGRDFDISDPSKSLSLFSPESIPVLTRAWQRAVEWGEPYELELEIVRPTGARAWVCSSSQAVIENGRVSCVVGNILDITERKKEQVVLESMNQILERCVAERTAEVNRYADQLRILAGRLIRAEESERQRITHILHEDLQQILVATRMTLESARDLVEKGAVQDSLGRVHSMLSRAIGLTRTVVRDLVVPGVKEGELADAVRGVAQQMKEKFGLDVSLVVKDELKPANEEVYLCVYRSVQEILFNVVKHAKVMHAEVTLQKATNDSVRITIKDGGVGFTRGDFPEENKDPKGMGLFGIRQRVEGLGGKLEIKSEEGKGTTLILTLPLRDSK